MGRKRALIPWREESLSREALPREKAIRTPEVRGKLIDV